MKMQIQTDGDLYIKEWNNESLVEHNLTYHSTDVKRRFVGNVDFQSPSKAMIEKEHTAQNNVVAIMEDAEDCAHKLNFLQLAREASKHSGIHRVNSNAGMKIFCAIHYYCDGKSQRMIGGLIKKRHAVVDRYIDRFTDWSEASSSYTADKINAEQVIALCAEQNCPAALADNLDILRMELTDLFHDLLEAANDPGNSSTEVYLNPEQRLRSTKTAEIIKHSATL